MRDVSERSNGIGAERGQISAVQASRAAQGLASTRWCGCRKIWRTRSLTPVRSVARFRTLFLVTSFFVMKVVMRQVPFVMVVALPAPQTRKAETTAKARQAPF